MAQEDILNLMQQQPDKEYRSNEISNWLGLNISTINVQLRRLYKGKFVYKREVRASNGLTKYRYFKYGLR